MSIANEEFLYRLFGIDAEILIDHAWGKEPCTLADIKNYRPKGNSRSVGQVLSRPYRFDEARLVYLISDKQAVISRRLLQEVDAGITLLVYKPVAQALAKTKLLGSSGATHPARHFSWQVTVIAVFSVATAILCFWFMHQG